MHPILSVQKERFEPVFLFLACHLQSLEHRICELQVSVSQILELVGKFRSKLFLVTDHHYLLSAEDRNEDLWLQGMSRFIDNHTEVHFIPHVLPVVLLVTGFPKLFRNQFMTINASSANDTERLDKCPITFLNERQKLILLFCEILFKLFYFLDGFFDILLLFFPNEGFFDVIKSWQLSFQFLNLLLNFLNGGELFLDRFVSFVLLLEYLVSYVVRVKCVNI